MQGGVDLVEPLQQGRLSLLLLASEKIAALAEQPLQGVLLCQRHGLNRKLYYSGAAKLLSISSVGLI